MNKTRKRTMALLLAGLFFAALLFSVFYVAGHAEHDCSGEDCEICTVLELCAHTLRMAALGLLLIALAPVLHRAACLGRAKSAQRRVCTSLIAWRVELLN